MTLRSGQDLHLVVLQNGKTRLKKGLLVASSTAFGSSFPVRSISVLSSLLLPSPPHNSCIFCNQFHSDQRGQLRSDCRTKADVSCLQGSRQRLDKKISGIPPPHLPAPPFLSVLLHPSSERRLKLRCLFSQQYLQTTDRKLETEISRKRLGKIKREITKLIIMLSHPLREDNVVWTCTSRKDFFSHSVTSVTNITLRFQCFNDRTKNLESCQLTAGENSPSSLVLTRKIHSGVTGGVRTCEVLRFECSHLS